MCFIGRRGVPLGAPLLQANLVRHADVRLAAVSSARLAHALATSGNGALLAAIDVAPVAFGAQQYDHGALRALQENGVLVRGSLGSGLDFRAGMGQAGPGVAGVTWRPRGSGVAAPGPHLRLGPGFLLRRGSWGLPAQITIWRRIWSPVYTGERFKGLRGTLTCHHAGSRRDPRVRPAGVA